LSRIKSDNVQIGSDFLVPLAENNVHEETPEEKALVLSAEEKAKLIIEEARNQAAELIEEAKVQAKEEVAQMAEAGRKAGFEAGQQQGLKDITSKLTDKIVAVNDFASGCFEVKDAIIKSSHLDMVNLVIQIARKICSKELEINEDVLKELTLNAIHSLKDKEQISIIVNPDMAEKIYAISDELKEKIPQLSSIKIIEDMSVSPDGVIVESPLSRVDSRVSSQINKIADGLFNKLNSLSPSELMPEQEETEIQPEITDQDLTEQEEKTEKFDE
jgi:flagellar assembly protein FliH